MTWTSCGKGHGDVDVYAISAQGADEVIHLGRNAILAVKHRDPVVYFAVFDLHDSDIDGSNPRHAMLMHGEGPGSLRECRHIWWGEIGTDGYTFGLNFAVVESALRELRRWFDGD
ncbi:MAG: hypothetical protein ACTHU0_19180 [Kofleriaceae bacterium]